MSLQFGSIERLEAHIDFELQPLWEALGDIDDENRELATAIARDAWGRGYVYGLREPERGEFARNHGFIVPGRGV